MSVKYQELSDEDEKSIKNELPFNTIDSRQAEFRSIVKQNSRKIKITMDYGLSPYFFVDWLRKRNGGAIWGYRFMIEVPLQYETLVTDLEYEIRCMDVVLECVREKYPVLQGGKVILLDSGWVKKAGQAALIVQTRVNFVRELFSFLRQSCQSPVEL
ncbi:MAG: hypothetical protein ACXADY_25405 [Candidatus Hodarchaeales archaeon]